MDSSLGQYTSKSNNFRFLLYLLDVTLGDGSGISDPCESGPLDVVFGL